MLHFSLQTARPGASRATTGRACTTLCAAVALSLLAACKGEESSRMNDAGFSRQPVMGTLVSTRDLLIDPSRSPGDLPGPWGRFFVSGFDMAQVQRIRATAAFRANDLSYTLHLPGHPSFERRTTVSSNPLRAIRADYAHSTGLTGAGQIISIIDDLPLLSHEQFAGKTIHGTAGGADFHATAVASVAAGNGGNGGTIGVAPGAALHFGALSYAAPLDWRALAASVDEASALGAIAMNNSWGLTGETVASGGLGSFRGSGQQAYIAALHGYAENGVIVFSMQNDHPIRSASAMAALPLAYPALEGSWLAVVNAIPTFDDARISSAVLVSTGCYETARFCLAANGQYRVATERGPASYATGSGASFAAPQVAGAMALLGEAFPDLSPAHLRDRLLATANNTFFTPTGIVTFAPGVAHGYNAEFGHGFLDLRAALLPIGEAHIAVARGGQIPLGAVALAGGAASGDAVVTALSRMHVAATDDLHGTFRMNAGILGTAGGAVDVTRVALAAFTMRPADLRAARYAALADSTVASPPRLLATPPPEALVGAAAQPVFGPQDGLRLDLLLGDPALPQAVQGISVHGVSVAKDVPFGGGSLSLGLRILRAEGSVMGLTMPGYEAETVSDMGDIGLGIAAPLWRRTVLRLDRVMGQATGRGAGMIRDFSRIGYDATMLSLTRADLMRRGDVVSAILRQPVAMTRGTARIDLPQSYSNGAPGFASAAIRLAPGARQFDLGVEYHTPLTPGVTLAAGLLWSDQAGHHAGKRAFAGLVGLQFSF